MEVIFQISFQNILAGFLSDRIGEGVEGPHLSLTGQTVFDIVQDIESPDIDNTALYRSALFLWQCTDVYKILSIHHRVFV